MKRIIITVLLIGCCLVVWSQEKNYEPNWKSLDTRQTPEWFTDAKFGIFIHWGVYSVPAWAPTDIAVGKNFGQKFSEWYWYRLMDSTNKYFAPHHKKLYNKNSYQDFATEFKAEQFNPNKWADIIEDSGAKYVVLTSKHHDGYTLWPSEQSWNWNSVDVGSHRDLCGELTTAVKNKGLHMGFYYSLYEWFNPLYKNNLEKYVDTHMIPQMKDLVTRYKPDVLWTDGEWAYTADKFKSQQFLSWLYNESDVKENIVVNDRWGKNTRGKHGGFYTTEYDHVYQKEGVDEEVYHPWEECRGIGGSFGYNRMENLEHYSSSKQLVNMLIQKVAGGGNLLLNIGPTSDGRIPVIMQQRLSDIGDWLDINGEAIYETTQWKKAPKTEEGIYFTKKGKDVYIICTEWKSNIKLPLNGKKVSLLGSDVAVSFKNTKKGMTINAPLLAPNQIPCNYAWVFKVENAF